jgi:hypothetical protein
MNQPYCNDQAYIAEAFYLDEDYISQMARLAHFKINSYKLSQIKASFCKTRDELEVNLQSTLLNYTSPAIILSDLGFFGSETDN